MAITSTPSIIVNLWDSLFLQSECSVAFQTSEHVHYERNQSNWEGITLFTDGNISDGSVDRVKSGFGYKIGWLREPECLHPDTYERAWEWQDKFDYILTHYAPLLAFPKFKFCPYGGIWIDRKHWGLKPKTKLVSMLIGSKHSTDGHEIRQRIYSMYNRKEIDWYGIYGTPTDYSAETKRMVLQDYMFTIISETCRQDNLFTEILLDCFAVGTIPIFWGAPNIGKFFDPDGIIPYKHALDIGDIMDELSDMLYDKMQAAAFANFQECQQYAVTEDWIYHNVFEKEGMI